MQPKQDSVIHSKSWVKTLQHESEILGCKSIFLLVDAKVKQLYDREIEDTLRHQNAHILDLPLGGEEVKELTVAQGIWQQLIDAQATKSDLLVCIGGGAVCDLGGWVATNYKRGIRHINIPTTLLAMVDAAIGGKNGINLEGIKNVIGSYKIPQKVIIDPIWLSTLSEFDMQSGMGEMLKYGWIEGGSLWEEILSLSNTYKVEPWIDQCIASKLRIVEVDPFEKRERKILNLGHTIGHAVEGLAMQRGAPISHGSCVAIGMLWEMLILRGKGIFQQDKEQERLRGFVHQHYVSDLEQVKQLYTDPSCLMPYLVQDKKNEGAGIPFVAMAYPHADMELIEIPELELSTLLNQHLPWN